MTKRWGSTKHNVWVQWDDLVGRGMCHHAWCLHLIPGILWWKRELDFNKWSSDLNIHFYTQRTGPCVHRYIINNKWNKMSCMLFVPEVGGLQDSWILVYWKIAGCWRICKRIKTCELNQRSTESTQTDTEKSKLYTGRSQISGEERGP